MTRTSFNGVLLVCFALVLLALPLPEGGSSVSTGTLTGVHWGASSDLSTLKSVGYDFDIRTVNPNSPGTWGPALDAAEAQGLKLIIGGYPEPYSYENGEWTISPAGVQLLEYLSTRSSAILALFVYNEPYWVNPFTGQTNPCGALSADQLRALRAKIRTVWPDAKIYHDIGEPSRWAPGGSLHRSYPCIGDRYADATGVADYVGAWYYPFRTSGYRKAEGLAALERESDYISNSMGAVTVWLNQVHACCGDLIWPSDTQILDWNCSTRSSLPTGSLISWYVWRQQIYQDYLANHPEQWSLTTAAACASAPQAPANTALPAIGGTGQEGQVLTTSTGTWSNSPTGYAYQWRRCDSTGGACASVTGATAAQFTLSSADVGKTLRAVVMATNAGGSNSATSAATAVVQTDGSLSAAASSGEHGAARDRRDGQEGQVLTTSTGTWSNSPTGYAYQWRRCDSTGGACASVTGATAAQFTLSSADVGKTLRAVVMATNAGGSNSATSAATAVVQTDGSLSAAASSGEHGAARDRRDGAGRSGAHDLDRHLVELAHRIRIPVATLRLDRRGLRLGNWSNGGPVHTVLGRRRQDVASGRDGDERGWLELRDERCDCRRSNRAGSPSAAASSGERCVALHRRATGHGSSVAGLHGFVELQPGSIHVPVEAVRGSVSYLSGDWWRYRLSLRPHLCRPRPIPRRCRSCMERRRAERGRVTRQGDTEGSQGSQLSGVTGASRLA